MEPEEVQVEELGNNPSEEGTPEQAETETTETSDVVEETPEEDPLASLPEEQREALIRAAQGRFTPAQQAKAEEVRLAKEEARLAKEEVRIEREQRLAYERRMEELQGKVPKQEEKKEPEDVEPDPVMDHDAWNKWSRRQEIKPLYDMIHELKAEKEQERITRKVETDYARLAAAYPDIRNESTELAKTFEAFLTSKGEREQRLTKLYRAGHIEAEELLSLALGSKAPAVAEAKVKQDLVRKANAQVSGGQSKPPSSKKYSSLEDAISESIREQSKG